ncbi:MAG: hypothetical protein V3U13_03790 [Gemmatimonadota bacterium]
MRACYLAILCATVLSLTSCEEEQVTGQVVGPLVGPRVAESLLALEVLDGVPIGITDIFRLDEFVNLWVHWEDLEPPHTVAVEWFDPLGSSFATDVELEARAREQVTVFTLELTSLSAIGRWEVAIYLDDEFMRSHVFLVVEFLPGE